MDDATFELTENVYERILSSSNFDMGELGVLEECINRKLNEVEEKLQNEELQIETELRKGSVSIADGGHICTFDSLALQCFLNNVLQAIERNAGFEDYILKDVLEFCYINGVALPLSSDENQEEITSLHTVADKNEEESFLLWKKICKQLKAGIMALLQNFSTTTITDKICLKSVDNDRQVYLFDLLLSIFQFDTVFKSYCNLRQGMLRSEEPNPNGIKGLSNKIKASISVLCNVIQKQLKIAHEDFHLLKHFCTEEEILSCFRTLFVMYEDIVSLHASSFLDFYNKVSYQNIDFTSVNTDKNVDFPVFSTDDLHNFSRVFCCFSNRSQCLKSLVRTLVESKNIKSDPNATNLLQNEESIEKGFHNILKWKKQFVPYLPLLKKVIPSYVHCVCHVIIDTHKKELVQVELIKMMNVADMFQNEEHCPRKVTKHCGTFLSLINKMIIFVTIDDDKQSLRELHEVSTLVLIDAFSIHHQFLKEVLQNSQTNIQLLYQLLCDICLIHHQLQQWETVISEPSQQKRGVLKLSCSNYDNIKEECMSLIIGYHIKMIKSSIVFDDHGNNWLDDKPFFEGERCSFTVQMWNYYIRGMLFDFQTFLPKKSSQKLLKTICTDMLEYFASYYTGVQTSYRRAKQLKADIRVVLSTFRWLLLYVSKDLNEILNVENKGLHHWHVLCRHLFDVMVITSSPLSQVCDYLTNHSSVEEHQHHQLYWFDQVGTYKFLNHENVLALDRTCIHPIVDWEIIQKLMTNNNAELPIVLVKYSLCLQQPNKSKTEEGGKASSINHEEEIMFVEEIGEESISYGKVKKEELCLHLYKVLSVLNKKSFIHFMASLIAEDDSKSFKISSANQVLPLWLQLIAYDLDPIFKRILKPSLELIFAEYKYKKAPSFKFDKLQTLPCGCSTTVREESERFLTGSQLLHKCLMLTLSALIDNMSLLPKKIWQVLAFVKTQPQFSQSWIKTPNLGTKILVCLMYNWLVSKENITSLISALPQYTFDNINSFAELLWHVIYNLTNDVTENPRISMDIQKNLQKSGEEISESLNTFHSYFDETAMDFDSDDVIKVDFKSSIGFEPDNIQNLSSLKYLHSILQTNQMALMKLLQNPETSNVNFTNSRQFTEHYQMANRFHSLHQYKIIGQGYIDHFDLLEGLIDWDELIKHVPKTKWQTLLSNRFEFLESSESILTDEEKEQVGLISELFGGMLKASVKEEDGQSVVENGIEGTDSVNNYEVDDTI